MNEIIKQLAQQAGMVGGGYANTPDKIMTWRESFDNPGSLEKFAKLIVKECIDIAQDRANFPGFPPNDVNHIIDEIREHFGVEE